MSLYANRFLLLQIRNVVRAAHALASEEGVMILYSYLEIVINSGKEFETDANGAGATDAIRGYF
jgi:hypothetical protein